MEIIASETDGPCWIARRPIAGARVAERRFVSKHTGNRSLQNWIAPLFEDEKMRNNMPLSSQILSSRKDRIRFVKRGIFFLSFRTIVDEIHSSRSDSSVLEKRGQKMRATMTVTFYFITFYFINGPSIIAAAKAVKK